ncbi:MAG: hypothetical protein ACPG7F_14395, partial [Aggregatilineales bacterium]
EAAETTEADSFQLTATGFIRNATATVEAQTGATSAPVATQPAQSASGDPFELTATQLVAQATQTADAGGSISEPETPSSQSDSPLGILMSALLGILGLFGLIGTGISQTRKKK